MADRLATIRASIADLRRIRTTLRAAGAENAANAVQRALKSVEGAERHAMRLANDAARSARPAPE